MSKEFKKVTLKNGLRVILVPRPDAIAVTTFVMVEAGSKYETKEISGLSHFLEHMCFKGTIARPTALTIASEFDAMGAQNNAFTSQEYTGYYATVEPKQFRRSLNILADMYLNPTFPAAELEKEKGVIIEEINMYEDLPQRKVYDLLMGLVYGDQPAGQMVLGNPEAIRSMTRDHFVKYRSDHYVASKTVIAIAGNFEEGVAIEAIKKEFAAIGTGKKIFKIKTKETQKAPRFVLRPKESDQAHLIVAFRALPAGHKDFFTMELLAAVLGGGMSSRLWQKIREEMGAAYYVRAGQDSYTDHGLLQIAVGADTKRAREVLQVILTECRRLAKDLIPTEELTRIKQSAIGHLFLNLETTSSLAGYYGLDEIVTGELRSPKEVAKRLNQVTAAEIRSLAKKIFTKDRLNVALIGPFKDEKIFVETLAL